MKKIAISFFIFVLLSACSSGSSEKDKKDEADITKDPDYQKGLALVTQNKCFTCHNIDDPLTGPPYREVAKKYAGASDAMITQLAQKIIKGGNGGWGEVFMTPHPAVSEEDAKAMVRYVLLLKK